MVKPEIQDNQSQILVSEAESSTCPKIVTGWGKFRFSQAYIDAMGGAIGVKRIEESDNGK